MPYAYQCCAFGVCENVYKISNQWNKGDNSSAEDLHKKDAGIFQVQGKISYVTDKTVRKGLEKSQTDHLSSRQASVSSPQQDENQSCFLKSLRERENSFRIQSEVSSFL